MVSRFAFGSLCGLYTSTVLRWDILCSMVGVVVPRTQSPAAQKPAVVIVRKMHFLCYLYRKQSKWSVASAVCVRRSGGPPRCNANANEINQGIGMDTKTTGVTQVPVHTVWADSGHGNVPSRLTSLCGPLSPSSDTSVPVVDLMTLSIFNLGSLSSVICQQRSQWALSLSGHLGSIWVRSHPASVYNRHGH